MQRIQYCQTAERAIMLCKAAAMGDATIYWQLCSVEDPRECKRLGRMVSNFNQGLWNNIVCSVAYQVLRQKFCQNKEAWKQLENTGQQIIVEASPTDFIWGAGMSTDHCNIKDPRTWKGTNILGWALMQVRATLNNVNNHAATAEVDQNCADWVDSQYQQMIHSRVRNYYLPCRQGPY